MTNWFDVAEGDDRAIAAFMARVAALPAAAPARDPMLLWWKAQLVRRWDAERRAQAPLEVMERVEIVAGLAAAVMLLAWIVPTVARMIAEPLRSLLG
jgi:hypothetical protein